MRIISTKSVCTEVSCLRLLVPGDENVSSLLVAENILRMGVYLLFSGRKGEIRAPLLLLLFFERHSLHIIRMEWYIF